jgi:hypothetical protein
MDTQTQNQTQINLNDIKPEQSIQILYQLMNKANKSGAFTIDESYSIKILLEKLATELKVAS